jgi:hypothetical protein
MTLRPTDAGCEGYDRLRLSGSQYEQVNEIYRRHQCITSRVVGGLSCQVHGNVAGKEQLG